MEKYLSAHDASRILGVTGNAVHLMDRRGELPVAAETESGIRLFRRGDVQRLADERAAKRRPDNGLPARSTSEGGGHE